MRQLKRPQAGLTLVELLIALAIAAMLALAAAPSFSDYLANSRLRESGSLAYLQALLAQSEAIKRNTTVRFEIDGNVAVVSDLSDPDDPVVVRSVPLGPDAAADDMSIDFGGAGRPLDFASAEVDFTSSKFTCSTEIRCPGLRIDGGGAIRLCADHTTLCD